MSRVNADIPRYIVGLSKYPSQTSPGLGDGPDATLSGFASNSVKTCLY